MAAASGLIFCQHVIAEATVHQQPDQMRIGVERRAVRRSVVRNMRQDPHQQESLEPTTHCMALTNSCRGSAWAPSRSPRRIRCPDHGALGCALLPMAYWRMLSPDRGAGLPEQDLADVDEISESG